MSRVLDLSRNEGDLPPARVLAELQERGPEMLRDYAEPDALEADLARYAGVSPDRVLVTTGGDDALDRAFRALVEPGQEVVFAVPTFEMVPAFTRMVRARPVTVDYEWGGLPLDALREAVSPDTAMVLVISPDNPTGIAASGDELVALARDLPDGVILLVDQAYVEFADEDPTSALLEEPNVLLVRTLSKAWGLAGLRIGYALSTPERIRELREVGGPYPVSTLGLHVARSRLAEGTGRLAEFVEETRTRRERLADLLAEEGASPIPSQTNFVMARYPDPGWIRRGLEAQGIKVRSFPALPEHLRITVPRSDQEMERLEGALAGLSRPQAVLFDMDGVLADVSRSYREAIRRTCLAFGLDVGGEAVAAAKSRGDANDDWQLTWTLLAEGGVDAPLSEVTRVFEELYQGTDGDPGLWQNEALIPARELLDRMAARTTLGIVTGRPRRDAVRFLAQVGLDDHFRVVVCREDAPLKPDPEPVRLAMDRLGVDTAWLLGDTPDDLRAARAAGAVPVGVIPPGGGAVERDALDATGAARIVEANVDFGGLFNE